MVTTHHGVNGHLAVLHADMATKRGLGNVIHHHLKMVVKLVSKWVLDKLWECKFAILLNVQVRSSEFLDINFEITAILMGKRIFILKFYAIKNKHFDFVGM